MDPYSCWVLVEVFRPYKLFGDQKTLRARKMSTVDSVQRMQRGRQVTAFDCRALKHDRVHGLGLTPTVMENISEFSPPFLFISKIAGLSDIM